MTEPNDLKGELAEVLALSEKAVAGTWCATVGDMVKQTHGHVVMLPREPRAPISADNAAFIAAAVNFLRTHGARLKRALEQNETMRVERMWQEERFQRACRILSGVHSILYPPVTVHNGVAYKFCPVTIDPHEYMQALSDRIRAIPDEIAAIDTARASEQTP